jgi:hypothetical protein
MVTEQYPLKGEVVGLLQKTSRRSSLRDSHPTAQSFDSIDAFVMAHTSLEFDEFFVRLQQLDAWRELVTGKQDGR